MKIDCVKNHMGGSVSVRISREKGVLVLRTISGRPGIARTAQANAHGQTLHPSRKVGWFLEAGRPRPLFDQDPKWETTQVLITSDGAIDFRWPASSF